MKMNTFTFRESFDRAPYRKNACVFESRFPIHALRAFLVHISAAPDNALTIPTGATGIPTAAQNVMISAWETEDSDGSCVALPTPATHLTSVQLKPGETGCKTLFGTEIL